MRTIIAAVIIAVLGAHSAIGAVTGVTAKDRVVKIWSGVQSTTTVRISWAAEPDAASFVVSRKPFGDQSTVGWSDIATITSGSATHYDDTIPAAGTKYEYRVKKTSNTNPSYVAYGYTACGISVEPDHNPRKIILVQAYGTVVPDAFKNAL